MTITRVLAKRVVFAQRAWRGACCARHCSGGAGSDADGTREAAIAAFRKLDIRVGQMAKVWKHESADKLFCEEIDVAEPEPRQIASGLVPYYSAEQLEGSHVLVVCNLKPAKLVGFKSHGMVLCAVSDDGAAVEIVEPPEGSVLGERVALLDSDGGNGDHDSDNDDGNGNDVHEEPASANQVGKRKLMQSACQALATDGDRVARCGGLAVVTSAGMCTARTLDRARIY